MPRRQGRLAREMVELKLLFIDGELHCDAKWKDSPDIFERVSGAFLFMMRYKKYASNRWCSAGGASKAFVGTMIIGLDALVELTRADSKVSDFHLRGYDRCVGKVRQMFAIATLGSRVPDYFL